MALKKPVNIDLLVLKWNLLMNLPWMEIISVVTLITIIFIKLLYEKDLSIFI